MDWVPDDYCGAAPTWSPVIYGGWLDDEPDDSPSTNCEENRNENVMLFVFNEGDVSGVHGFEDMSSNGVFPALIMRPLDDVTTNGYQRNWAYEFRYDSGRERYLYRKLDHTDDDLPALTSLWSDYDGGAIYGDHTISGTTATEVTAFMPGIAQQDVPTGDATWFLNNHIGTTRTMLDDNADVVVKRLYTAFGELIELTGSGQTRYGYAGAWGYQEHDINADGTPDNAFGALPGALFPFVHVGARHYDPSTGRFLQRDPIGINGGLNVYEYVYSIPTMGVDPFGFGFWDGNNWFHDWVARKLWMKVHSTKTLANMSGTRATVEAVGASVLIGAGGYYIVTYAGAAVAGRAGWVAVRVGTSRGTLHFVYGSNVGWFHYLGPTGYMAAHPFYAGWGYPFLYFLARNPGAIANLGNSYNCFTGAMYAFFTAL